MNFENYKGKRVRVNTNIIDETSDGVFAERRYKTIEGIYDGHDGIGTQQYIIIDGESYPEMCIISFGLAPEQKEVKIHNKVEVVEEDFIPAFTLQVDPFNMVNDALDELEIEEVYPHMSVWSRLITGNWIVKTLAVFTIFLLSVIGCVASSVQATHINTQSNIELSHPTLPNYITSCKIIDTTGINHNLINCSEPI